MTVFVIFSIMIFLENLIFLDWKIKMADLNEQDLLDYDEEEQEVKDIKAKKDVKVNILTLGGTREQNYI